METLYPLLYEQELGNKKVTNLVVESDKVTIGFDEDVVDLSYHHDQDCCETVYADFDTVTLYSDQIKSTSYTRFYILGVKEMGIMLCFATPYRTLKVLVPCYNEQNGYYSDDLELIVRHNDLEVKMDITEFKEDNED